MENLNISVNGTEIHVSTRGDVKKKAVVFIHGNSLNSETFKEQISAFSFPVVTIDLPGHGRSQPAKAPEQTYSISGYAEAIAAVIAQLGLTDYILAGHSLGGHIAVNAAKHLKSLRGIIIFGTPPIGAPESLGSAFLPNPLFPFLFTEQLSENDAAQLAEGMLLDNSHKAILQESILNTHGGARMHFGASVGKGLIENEVEIIKSLGNPIAILHGESDRFVNKEYIESLKLSNLWGNRIQVIEKSGHVPQMENAAAFNELIKSYYTSVHG